MEEDQQEVLETPAATVVDPSTDTTPSSLTVCAANSNSAIAMQANECSVDGKCTTERDGAVDTDSDKCYTVDGFLYASPPLRRIAQNCPRLTLQMIDNVFSPQVVELEFGMPEKRALPDYYYISTVTGPVATGKTTGRRDGDGTGHTGKVVS
jgi:hypothetical protein